MSEFWSGLRPASFRGASFDAFEQHSESGGRRLVMRGAKTRLRAA